MTSLSVVRDVEDAFVAQLLDKPAKFRQCREVQHRWKLTDPFRVVDSNRETQRRPRGGHRIYAERIFTCERCGMERWDAYAIGSRRGHTALSRIGSEYMPPDGYAIEGLGNTRGMTDLLHGVEFDQAMAQIKTPPRSRRGKATG